MRYIFYTFMVITINLYSSEHQIKPESPNHEQSILAYLSKKNSPSNHTRLSEDWVTKFYNDTVRMEGEAHVTFKYVQGKGLTQLSTSESTNHVTSLKIKPIQTTTQITDQIIDQQPSQPKNEVKSGPTAKKTERAKRIRNSICCCLYL